MKKLLALAIFSTSLGVNAAESYKCEVFRIEPLGSVGTAEIPIQFIQENGIRHEVPGVSAKGQMIPLKDGTALWIRTTSISLDVTLFPNQKIVDGGAGYGLGGGTIDMKDWKDSSQISRAIFRVPNHAIDCAPLSNWPNN